VLRVGVLVGVHVAAGDGRVVVDQTVSEKNFLG
jgi:hypothetical protein